jgi:small basic protein
MILLPLLALVLGFVLMYLPARGLEANEALARYTAIALLAGFDTVVGGWRAWIEDKYDNSVFLSGFVSNSLLGVGLVALGEQLGLQTGVGDERISVMMIAAAVVFGSRILQNLAALRRLLIERVRHRHEISDNTGETAAMPTSL